MLDPPFLRVVAALAEPVTPDDVLLKRFVGGGDVGAFELLVRRHSAMVWAVCRSVLPSDRHTAEDAFQATFLALARRAGAIRDPSAAGWLFRVARNAAGRARSTRPVEASLSAELPDTAPDDRVEAAEVGAVVTEEVGRLPARLREPLLLCYFEGCSHPEAAVRLGLPVGTVASRLARAKDRLRVVLTRRGLAPAAAGVTAATLCMPTPAMSGLVRNAVATALDPTRGAPPTVDALAREVLNAMTRSRMKSMAAAALLIGVAVATIAIAADGSTQPAAAAPEAAVVRNKARVYIVQKVYWAYVDRAEPMRESEPGGAGFPQQVFADRAAALVDCWNRNQAARNEHGNPFPYGRGWGHSFPSLADYTSTPTGEFLDWLESEGLALPPGQRAGWEAYQRQAEVARRYDPQSYSAWWQWWNDYAARLPVGQRARIWDKLDRVRFYEVVEAHF